MVANISPVFPLTPNVTWALAIGTTAANTTVDLTSGTLGTNLFLLYTAGANGARVDYVRARQVPGVTVQQTVLRLWINNGSTNSTAANNTLFMERTLGSTTTSVNTEMPDQMAALNVSIPAGYKIYATLGTAPVATGTTGGYALTAVGGDY
jgi:hypothetical protein